MQSALRLIYAISSTPNVSHILEYLEITVYVELELNTKGNSFVVGFDFYTLSRLYSARNCFFVGLDFYTLPQVFHVYRLQTACTAPTICTSCSPCAATVGALI